MVKIRIFLKVSIIFVLSWFSKIATGILCYECINQPTHGHCMKYGKITRCMTNQYSCQTDVRLHRFLRTGQLITKRCKQTNACINNFLQNAANCKPYRDNTVCFCCCHHSRCNLRTDECWKDYSGAVLPSRGFDKCESFNGIANFGKLSCKDGYRVGSVCEFRSNNSKRKPSFKRKCVKNAKGLIVWKNLSGPPEETPDEEILTPPGEINAPGGIDAPGEIQASREPTCAVAKRFPNQRINCTDEGNIGSNCIYECSRGYAMDGDNVSTCIRTSDGAEWNSLPPFCTILECQPLIYRMEDFMDSGCSNGSLLGSACNFRCDIGFMLTPFESSTIRCEERNGELRSPDWSSRVPDCSPLSCASFEIGGGAVSCTNEFYYNSVCDVTCLSGHVIQPSNFSAITCMHDLMWSHLPPTCEAVYCSNYDVPNAHVNCTNGALWESNCSVSCINEEHRVRPYNFTSATCMRDGFWTRDPPCCAKPCPPITPIDMVIILDSSSSVGRSNWDEMKRFVVQFISLFNIGSNSTNMAVFQYHREVNRVTEILLNQFNDLMVLRQAVLAMPYKGRGTWTGIALGHAASISLHPSNGNRKQYHDFVVVITDGQVNMKDDPLMPAQQLLNEGAKVFAIGISPDRLGKRRYTWQQLLSITGNHEDRVFPSKDKIHRSVSPREIYEAITNVVCESLCKHP